MIAGNMLQQAYNLADTWVVGRFIGSDALAAAGLSFALITFLNSIVIGLSMGSSVVFSVSIGSQDEKRLKSALGASFAITAGMALILCLLSLVLLKPLMVWLNTPAELNDMTAAYLRVILCGIPAVGIYNFFAAYLRSKGDSETPLIFLALSSALNIALDLLFVIVFKMGIEGAAIATLIAEVLSAAAIAGYSLHSDSVLKTGLWPLKTDRQALAEIADYSFLTCLQQSVMNLGILMVQGIVNGFGPTVMAAFAAGVKIDAFAYMPAQEYGNAFSTFAAQNRGGKTEQPHDGWIQSCCAHFAWLLPDRFADPLVSC